MYMYWAIFMWTSGALLPCISYYKSWTYLDEIMLCKIQITVACPISASILLPLWSSLMSESLPNSLNPIASKSKARHSTKIYTVRPASLALADLKSNSWADRQLVSLVIWALMAFWLILEFSFTVANITERAYTFYMWEILSVHEPVWLSFKATYALVTTFSTSLSVLIDWTYLEISLDSSITLKIVGKYCTGHYTLLSLP
jgi:hypothetical protein